MSEPAVHTLESFAALADAARNKVIAAAVRGAATAPAASCEGCAHAVYEGNEVAEPSWPTRCTHDPGPELEWCLEGRACPYWEEYEPLPFWTGDDPALCREMRDLMVKYPEAHLRIYHPNAIANPLRFRVEWWPSLHPSANAKRTPVVDTESQAWCLALVAAGLVPKEAP